MIGIISGKKSLDRRPSAPHSLDHNRREIDQALPIRQIQLPLATGGGGQFWALEIRALDPAPTALRTDETISLVARLTPDFSLSEDDGDCPGP